MPIPGRGRCRPCAGTRRAAAGARDVLQEGVGAHAERRRELEVGVRPASSRRAASARAGCGGSFSRHWSTPLRAAPGRATPPVRPQRRAGRRRRHRRQAVRRAALIARFCAMRAHEPQQPVRRGHRGVQRGATCHARSSASCSTASVSTTAAKRCSCCAAALRRARASGRTPRRRPRRWPPARWSVSSASLMRWAEFERRVAMLHSARSRGAPRAPRRAQHEPHDARPRRARRAAVLRATIDQQLHSLPSANTTDDVTGRCQSVSPLSSKTHSLALRRRSVARFGAAVRPAAQRRPPATCAATFRRRFGVVAEQA
jgi:hypothetical protein